MIEYDEVFDGQGNLLQRTERTVTPEEQADRKRQQTGLPLDSAEYEAIRTAMAPLRAIRQMTQAEFMALTAAQRDRMLYDGLVATAEVLRTILRD